MFERFTERARRAVVAAQEEARMLGHNHIGSEHLLLGLLHVLDGDQADVLLAAGITADTARAQVEELAGPSNKSPAGHIPFTPRAKKVLELSLREALEQGRGYIGTEHILLAVIREQDGMGARVLERLGGSLAGLRQRVLETASEDAPDAVAEEEGDAAPGPWNWQLARTYRREAGAQPQSVAGFRGLLTMIDRRLASIERALEIPPGDEEAGGFGALARSVDRRLASIERHLGVEPRPGKPEAAEE